MFENCFPNTLDTTVQFRTSGRRPDTFVITGDIDAMWLRDSSAQVWPYLPLAKQDQPLRLMLAGLIRRQAHCILLDPYANAFLPDASSKPLSWSVNDKTKHIPGVGERKWEVDSLCYPIRLAHGYWKATGDTAPFDSLWQSAMSLVVQTFRQQQRKQGTGPYQFRRETLSPTETLALTGFGNPARPVGLIFSMFRPSDDACIFPLFVPANFFAMTSLRQLAELSTAVLHDETLARDAHGLATEIATALQKFGLMRGSQSETVWAYEVDGYGGQLFMDDANAPGLLSLPYLGCCDISDPIYQRTRAQVLSRANPYFFKGTAASGIGGPHEGLNMIWPMSIIMRAFTSTDDAEILQCLRWLKTTTAGTGFIHESFEKDDPQHYTRAWFAWANTLYGELILHLAASRSSLLQQTL
jgi:meiotically up-regulated gene 157 (Mug157) protein